MEASFFSLENHFIWLRYTLTPSTSKSQKSMGKLQVINLFGAPGRGKSSVRSGVFWLMKSHHLSVEEVSEYAKYLVLTERHWQLKEEQLYLFSKQHHKQLIIERAGYEYAVTDSPLQLCAFYAPSGYYSYFDKLVNEMDGHFENINFFLTRDVESEPENFENRGRYHDLRASIEVEKRMLDFLDKKNIRFEMVNVDIFTPWRILEKIRPGLAPWPEFTKKD
jgi:hypothetical protein